MLHPNYIKFEKPKHELYLTYNAIADDGSKSMISEIQQNIEDIIKGSNELKDIEFIEDEPTLYNQIRNHNRFIYKYPLSTLHISITNFVTYNILNLQDFDNASNVIQKTSNFLKLLEVARSFEKFFLNEIINHNKPLTFIIKRLYLSGGIENSLSLSVFPLDQNFFVSLERISIEAKKMLDNEYISHNLEIKAYPFNNRKYFALNIFRFIDNENANINQLGSFYGAIDEINFDFKETAINMIPQLVISDPYFAKNTRL